MKSSVARQKCNTNSPFWSRAKGGDRQALSSFFVVSSPFQTFPRCHEWFWMGLVEERFPVEYAAWQCGMIRNDLASWDLRGDGVVSSCWRGAFGIPPWGGSNCAGVINPPLTLLFFFFANPCGEFAK